MSTATTTRLDELKAQIEAKANEASAIGAKADEAGRDFNDEERADVKRIVDEAKALKKERDGLLGDRALRDAVDQLGDDLGLAGRSDARKADPDRRKSAGERFTADPDLVDWLKRVAPSGQVTAKNRLGHSPPVVFHGLKDILAGGDDNGAGALLVPDYRGLIDSAGMFQRPLTVRNLVTNGTTSGDTISYTRVTGFTNNAAPVPEARGTSAGTGTADVTGRKPESSLTLEQVQDVVKTIAHWLPATKRALSDAAQVRTLVDNFLRYGLEEELEDQMLEGDGTGENFEGILNVSGIQNLGAAGVTARDPDASGTLAGIVALRIAKRLVRQNGRATPTAYVLNPEDNERIDLARDGNGQFYFGGPGGNGVSTAWALPRVESEAMPVGTALCADYRWAVLWDREQASIAVSDAHEDFFVRNLVAILAELRAGFGVLRPEAFVAIDLAEIFAIAP